MSAISRATAADALAQRYRAVRAATLALAQPLSAEDCALQSMPDASPTKWHLAHTSWYFETFALEPGLPGYRPFDSAFRVLFNSYYNGVGPQYARPQRGLLTRPSLAEVHAYRDHVDRYLLRLLEDEKLDGPLNDVIELGTHHEQQHQELILTDLKHLFAQNPLAPVYRESGPHPARTDLRDARFVAFPAGVREVGHAGGGFAFDNEGPRHRVYLEPFALASRPVTNREYLAFIDAGGYRDPEPWLADGWAAVQRSGWEAPLYWQRRDEGGWWTFTLRGLRELALDEPVVHVSFYEADAFARWAGARLPTEMEWEVAAASNTELAQLSGEVWQWTRSAYAPYPGYAPPAGALGEYNGKFMSNQIVLRGGSCATPADHTRVTYRNFFYPDARWQFSGIRLATDAHP
jgi:ergothioneine biosynthesis protein EgtB